jgi:hypothetical protein
MTATVGLELDLAGYIQATSSYDSFRRSEVVLIVAILPENIHDRDLCLHVCLHVCLHAG